MEPPNHRQLMALDVVALPILLIRDLLGPLASLLASATSRQPRFCFPRHSRHNVPQVCSPTSWERTQIFCVRLRDSPVFERCTTSTSYPTAARGICCLCYTLSSRNGVTPMSKTRPDSAILALLWPSSSGAITPLFAYYPDHLHTWWS